MAKMNFIGQESNHFDETHFATIVYDRSEHRYIWTLFKNAIVLEKGGYRTLQYAKDAVEDFYNYVKDKTDGEALTALKLRRGWGHPKERD